MKNPTWYSPARTLVCGGFGLTLGIIPLQAQDNGGTGPYLSLDAGVSMVEDVETTVDLGEGSVTGGVKLDPGMRFSLAAGYTFTSSSSMALAGEIETGVIYNSLDEVEASGFGSVPISGDFYQVPFLANLVVTIAPQSKWNGYVGAGGGGVYANIDIEGISSSETDGAFQAMAGVRYRLGQNTQLGVGYKFLMSFPEGIDSINTHAVGVIFTVGF